MIILVNDSPYFDLVIRGLDEVFNELHIPHQVVRQLPLQATESDSNLYLLCTVHEGKPLPKHYIAYNWEQLTTNKPWNNSFFDRLRRAHCVWDYSWNNVQLLKTKGISAIHVPLGYAKCMEFCRKDVPKDIDVVFLGSINEPRQQKLQYLLRSYRNRPEKLFISDSCWGNQMAQVYERTKIGLNLHYYGGKTILEVLRVIPMMANGLFVISEHGDDPWYESKFSDMVTWIDSKNPQDLLRKTIELLVLNSKEEQNQKKKAQHDFLVEHCSYISSVDRPEVLESLTL